VSSVVEVQEAITGPLNSINGLMRPTGRSLPTPAIENKDFTEPQNPEWT